MRRNKPRKGVPGEHTPGDHVPGKLPLNMLALALMTTGLLLATLIVPAAVAGSAGGGAVETTCGMEALKQSVADYVATSDGDLSARDVASFLNESGAGICANPVTGGEFTFNPADTANISAAALSQSKLVIAFSDQEESNGYGTAVIGTVSGTDITYGAEYVFNAYSTVYISAVALSESRFAVVYCDNYSSNYGTAVIGDITEDTVITYGSKYVFNSGAGSWYISAAALSSSTFVIAYQDLGNSNRPTAIIGTVSEAGITYGSEAVLSTTFSSIFSATALSSSKFVVAFRDEANSGYGTARIGTVSGSTITFGTASVFNPDLTELISAAALSDGKFVVAYRDHVDPYCGKAVIGDVSDGTITFGSEYTFLDSGVSWISAAALSGTRFVVVYDNSIVIGDVTGNVIAYGPAYEFNDLTGGRSVTTLSETRYVIAHQDFADATTKGQSRVGGIGPTMVTGAATEITDTSALLHGEITDIGGGLCDERGFEYRVEGDEYWSSIAWAGSFGTGTYSQTLGAPYEELTPGTTYEYRAAARNAAGNGYGQTLTFTTLWPVPAITSTSRASGKVGVTVEVNGTGFIEEDSTVVKFGQVPATEYTSMSETKIVCKVPAGAVGAVNLRVVTIGGTSNAVPFSVIPSLAASSPKAGTQGTVVTLTGSGFGATRGTSYVKFGGVKATNYVSWSATQIKVKVPAGASGAINVSVTTSGGRSNLLAFKVTPRITSLSPKAGAPGTQVTITGTGFGAKRGTSTVKFGITAVTSYVSWSNTQIVVKVPATGAGAKLVKVTTPGGTSAGASFTVQ